MHIILCNPRYAKILKFSSLNYEFFDAGLYFAKLWRTTNAEGLKVFSVALFQGHFQPIFLLYSIVSWMSGTPLALFLLQTLILCSSVIPIALISRDMGYNPKFGAIFCIIFLTNPLLHFNDILGFHPDQVVIPAIFWVFYFIERRRISMTFCALLVICSAGEQYFPLATALTVLFAVKCKQLVTSMLFATLIIAGFFTIKFILPSFFGSLNQPSLLLGVEGIYSSALNDPLGHISDVVSDKFRLFWLLFVFAPFLFTPLICRLTALPLSIEVSKVLLSSEKYHYAVEGHYTVGILSLSLIALMHTLKPINQNCGDNRAIAKVSTSLAITFALMVSHGVSPSPITFGQIGAAVRSTFKII